MPRKAAFPAKGYAAYTCPVCKNQLAVLASIDVTGSGCQGSENHRHREAQYVRQEPKER